MTHRGEPTIWPRWLIALNSLWTHLTWWPWRTMALRRAGMKRIAWMTWAEFAPPPEEAGGSGEHIALPFGDDGPEVAHE
jgi:hypothetical protein